MYAGIKVGSKINLFIFLNRLKTKVDSRVVNSEDEVLLEFSHNLNNVCSALYTANWTEKAKEKEVALYVYEHGVKSALSRYNTTKPTIGKILKTCENKFSAYISGQFGCKSLDLLREIDVPEYNKYVSTDNANDRVLFLAGYKKYLPDADITCDSDLAFCGTELQFLKSISVPYLRQRLSELSSNNISYILALLSSKDTRFSASKNLFIQYLLNTDNTLDSHILHDLVMQINKERSR